VSQKWLSKPSNSIDETPLRLCLSALEALNLKKGWQFIHRGVD